MFTIIGFLLLLLLLTLSSSQNQINFLETWLNHIEISSNCQHQITPDNTLIIQSTCQLFLLLEIRGIINAFPSSDEILNYYSPYSLLNFTIESESIVNPLYPNDIPQINISQGPNNFYISSNTATNGYDTSILMFDYTRRTNDEIDSQPFQFDLFLPQGSQIIIKNLYYSPVIFPSKYIFPSKENKMQRRNSSLTSEPCSLLGTTNALLLRQFNISFLPKQPSIKLFCGIFTTANRHNSHILPIRETWGQHCSDFLAFSTSNDESIPSINLPHVGMERYNNMWQKSRSIWKYLALHYQNDYDWFLLGGDDMFYIIDNLFDYLSSDFIMSRHMQGEGLYVGKPFIDERNLVYNTGGPGYLLNRFALQKLNEIIDQSYCSPWIISSMEDIYIADCLRNAQPTIQPIDTLDSYHRSRFHFFPPGYLYAPRKDLEDPQDHILHSILASDPYLSFGKECCSHQSISFHCIASDLMIQMYDFLYYCSPDTIHEYYQIHGETYADYEDSQYLYIIPR